MITLYKEAFEQAKKDLARATRELGEAQENAILAEGEIVELRQTIAALAKLCGESAFVEEDALGLTDTIRQVFKTHESASGPANGLDPQGVREKMPSPRLGKEMGCGWMGSDCARCYGRRLVRGARIEV
jgi:hypothetical protein